MKTHRDIFPILKLDVPTVNGIIFTKNAVQKMLTDLPLESLAGFVKLTEGGDSTFFIKRVFIESDMVLVDVEYLKDRGNVLKTKAVTNVMDVEEINLGVLGTGLLDNHKIISEFQLFSVSIISKAITTPDLTPIIRE